MDLKERATIMIELYRGDISIPISTIGKVLEKDEYDKWGIDETYIDTIVQRELQKLNTEPANE